MTYELLIFVSTFPTVIANGLMEWELGGSLNQGHSRIGNRGNPIVKCSHELLPKTCGPTQYWLPLMFAQMRKFGAKDLRQWE